MHGSRKEDYSSFSYARSLWTSSSVNLYWTSYTKVTKLVNIFWIVYCIKLKYYFRTPEIMSSLPTFESVHNKGILFWIVFWSFLILCPSQHPRGFVTAFGITNWTLSSLNPFALGNEQSSIWCWRMHIFLIVLNKVRTLS